MWYKKDRDKKNEEADTEFREEMSTN